VEVRPVAAWQCRRSKSALRLFLGVFRTPCLVPALAP
jgi:hypothetical protein